MQANEQREPFEERHFTVPELAEMWNLSREGTLPRQVSHGFLDSGTGETRGR